MAYYSCPNRFLGSSVNEFLAMRNHLEKYPHTAKPFHDQDPRYVAFDSYFSARLAEFRDMAKTTGGIT